MTSARQIAKLLRPYCLSHELSVRRNEVYLVPISHVVRGFSIYRTREATRFEIAIFIGTSFDPTLSSPRAFSRVDRYDDWLPRWNEPNLQSRFDDVIHRHVLPMLCLVDLPSLLPRHGARRQGPDPPSFADAFQMPHMRAPLHAAFGDFDDAMKQFDILSRIPRGHRIMEPVLKTLLDELQPLVRHGDRHGVAQKLRSWEETAMTRWNLRDHWRPTPFPLETLR